MLDPLSTLSAPPPRYLLESDSSDEEGQGQYPSTSARSQPAAAPSVSVKWLDDALAPTTAVVGVGQAGRYLQRRAGRLAVLSVEVDGRPAGLGFALDDDGVLIVLDEGDEKGNVANCVVEQLLDLVKAKNWTVLSSYVPALYIPAAGEVPHADPPVRHLSVGGSTGLAGYDAPNYVTGLAGAFLSQATHPAFALASVTLILLPLPLSRLSRSSLAAALDTLPKPIAQALARPAPWTEADDEPYVALGMGARRPVREAMPSAGDLSGMYM